MEAEKLEERARAILMKEKARKNNQTLCPRCRFEGTFIAECQETKNIYSFRCTSCNAASMLGYTEKYPGWKEEYSSQFKIIKF